MYKETNKRSVVKGVTWRIVATTTTMVIVYVFFGRLDLAIATGLLESVLKIGLYWAHERAWYKVRWGMNRIEPFNIWFTGLPLSGKTTIADAVYKKLEKFNIPLERLDSKDIRELLPNIGFTREDRNNHIGRIGHLIKTLQNNSISTVASFVSPYKESRKQIRDMVKNNIVVYVKADIETCKKRDAEGKYIKALTGQYQNFTGVSDVYEEPKYAEIVIDTDSLSVDDAVDEIVSYIKKQYLN
ncbi:MAG: adenylyl-sulfate kinase [Methylophaga sp.]|nr:adenylyl-sulfate kinase [Methylophaga sp.]